MTKNFSYAHVIVVGAGISGMVAAYNIWQHAPSMDILVLEANSRIGGRAFTIPLSAANNEIGLFDVGGQWISNKQILLMNLLKELEIELIPNKNEGNMITHFSRKLKISKNNDQFFENYVTEIEFNKFILQLETEIENVTFMNPIATRNYETLDNMTMEDYIKKSLKYEANQNFMSNLIKTSCGIDPSEISVLYYLAFCHGTQGVANQYCTKNGGVREFRIKGGTQQICEKIANIIGMKNVRKEEAVLKICQKKDEVIIETLKSIYICDQIIMAIPPKQILDINIEPPLHQGRMELLKKMVSGHIVTFVITYERAFWTEKGFSGQILTSGKGKTPGPIHILFDVTTDDNKPALSGCINVPDCFNAAKDAGFKSQVLDHLAFYYGKEALQPISYFEKCWWKEPYIGGSPMSCAGVGNMVNFNQINKPIGRIFWAGTETSNYWNGYIAGAVIAGHRAAIEVLYEMRPQSVTVADIALVQTRMKPDKHNTSVIVRATVNWKYYVACGVFISFVVYRIIKRFKK